MRNAEELRQRLREWEEASSQFAPGVRVRETLDWVPSELRWTLGEDPSGALRGVVWACLVGELHDAKCRMRMDGTDLVLEGEGNPADARHPHTFRFWLRLKGGRFQDKRTYPLPIQEIWILYREPTEHGFAFTAQDHTLSGVIEFYGDDYSFHMWDHAVPAPKR